MCTVLIYWKRGCLKVKRSCFRFNVIIFLFFFFYLLCCCFCDSWITISNCNRWYCTHKYKKKAVIMQKTTRKVAPDGGYAWIACFGVSLVNVSTHFYFFRILKNNFPFSLVEMKTYKKRLKFKLCDFITFVQNWFIIMKVMTSMY